MAELDDFDRNARANGLLVDTNLLVLLIVGLVNRDRISRFKRTTEYSSADWDLMSGIVRMRYTRASALQTQLSPKQPRLHHCSVLTNDSGLYAALANEGSSVAMFNHFRAFL